MDGVKTQDKLSHGDHQVVVQQAPGVIQEIVIMTFKDLKVEVEVDSEEEVVIEEEIVMVMVPGCQSVCQ